jgi:hypothetical protein
MEHGFMFDDLHVGIERVDGILSAIQLRSANVLSAVQKLALKVGQINAVKVDDAELSNARCGEVHRCWRSQPSSSYKQHFGGKQLFLSCASDVWKNYVPRISVDLIIRKSEHGPS